MKIKQYGRIFVLSTLFFIFQKSVAQSPECLWAKSMGGLEYEEGKSTAVDALGNVYIMGSFAGTVDFDPGPGIFSLTSTTIFYPDIFICKLNSSGNLLWAKQLGGVDNDVGNSIALDDSGNVYATGYFCDVADFDPGPAAYNLVSQPGWEDIFISKLDSSGNFIWANSIGGSYSNDRSCSIVLDDAGNVYTVGNYQGIVDFDPGAGISNLACEGPFDIFLLKLTTDGNYVWAKSIGGSGSFSSAFSIDLDNSGNLYTVGTFQDTVDFDPGSGFHFQIADSGNYSLFILKSDTAGNFIWVKQFDYGPNYRDQFYTCADATGNIYMAGVFLDTVDFDPGSGTYSLISAGGSDIFISKLDSSGNFVWTKQIGGSEEDNVFSITLDQGGSIYLTGSFRDTVDFDPGPAVFSLISVGGFGSQDIFISRLTAAGDFVWAKQIGDVWDEAGRDISVDPAGYLYLTGYFQSPTIAFDTFSLTNPSGGTDDIFIAKLDNVIAQVSGIEKTPSISVYPNPSNISFTISYEGAKKNDLITISEITGKIIYKYNFTGTKQIVLNTEEFEPGVYTLTISTSGYTASQKLIITH